MTFKIYLLMHVDDIIVMGTYNDITLVLVKGLNNDFLFKRHRHSTLFAWNRGKSYCNWLSFTQVFEICQVFID